MERIQPRSDPARSPDGQAGNFIADYCLVGLRLPRRSTAFHADNGMGGYAIGAWPIGDSTIGDWRSFASAGDRGREAAPVLLSAAGNDAR